MPPHRFVVLLIPMFVMLGCGQSGKYENMADVSGTITLNGKPLANAEVHFMNGDLGGYGKTDEQGRFRLVNGAPVGLNRVYITKGDPNNPLAGQGHDPALDEGQIAEMMKHKRGKKKKKSELPAKYSDPAKTELTIEVPEGGTDAANIDL